MPSVPTPQAGCFSATYPSTTWQPVSCVTAPNYPLPAMASTVGDGTDYGAASSSTLIGSSTGSFSDIVGLTSEADPQSASYCGSTNGANCYSLQDNSNTFPTTTIYTGNSQGTGWEQFIVFNAPGGSQIFIQYWLIGHRQPCPSIGPPDGTSWMYYPGSNGASGCYANSDATPVPYEAPSNLGNVVLTGYANLNSNDGVDFCVNGGGCYQVSITDQVLNLYQNWQYSEFNVFGYCCGFQANFNSGTSITVTNALADQSQNPITPSCGTMGYTAETNNLNLRTCFSNSNGQIVFDESSSTSTSLSSLSGFSGDASGQVLLVIGDLTVNGFDHGSKCCGVGYQVGRDTTPLGFISGMLTNPQPTVFDDNTAYVNTATGRPTTTAPLIFVIGGDGVNMVTNYYEVTNTVGDQSPVTVSIVGSNYVWTNRAGTQVASVPTSTDSVPPGNADTIVIEILTDTSGRTVVLIYGSTYLGVWAAAWYFENVIYPNISAYTHAYYIVQWSDTNRDGTPDGGDTFTVLAQG